MPSWISILAAAAIVALIICFFYGYLISRLDQFGAISSRLISISIACGMAAIPLVVIVKKMVPFHEFFIDDAVKYSLLNCYYDAAFVLLQTEMDISS